MNDTRHPAATSPAEFSVGRSSPPNQVHPVIRGLQWCLLSVVLLTILAVAVFAILFELSDPGPPLMLRNTVCESGSDDACSKAINAIVARKFPAGTPVSQVTADLASEGFKAKLDDNVPVPAAPNTRYYLWGKFPCGQFAIIEWSADAHGNISHISGSYEVRCV